MQTIEVHGWAGLALALVMPTAAVVAFFVHRDAKQLESTSPRFWAVCTFLIPLIAVPFWLYARGGLKQGENDSKSQKWVGFALFVGTATIVGFAVPPLVWVFILCVMVIFVLPITIWIARHY